MTDVMHPEAGVRDALARIVEDAVSAEMEGLQVDPESQLGVVPVGVRLPDMAPAADGSLRAAAERDLVADEVLTVRTHSATVVRIDPVRPQPRRHPHLPAARARRVIGTLALGGVLLLAACAPDPGVLSERIVAAVPTITADASLSPTSSPGLSNLSVTLGIDREPTGDELSDVLAAILEEPLDGVWDVSVGARSASNPCVDVGPAIDDLGLTAFAFDRFGVEECTVLLIGRHNLEEWWTNR